MYNYFIKHCLLSPATLFLRQLGGVLLVSFIVMICYLSISSFHNNDPQPIENLQRTIALVSTGETQPASPQGKNLNHVLYVISLDGKITAIDVRQKGRQIWTTHTGTSLIDSSLSQLEIVRNSRSIRLIPSLIGGLYEQYDDTEQIEPLPFDAESLLNTTFHLHDEWIMTGGKDIDTLALDLHTGQLVYSFSKHHLDQSASENSTCSAPMLIIKRIKQTVRARSARNGHEKWNFSVSNHELLHLYTPSSPEVLEQSNNHHEHLVFFEYQLQTGLILAFDSTNQLIWTSSINSPIAAVWEWRNGQLKEKSLFKTKLSRRLAFMGEFNSTPYVLISSRIQSQLIAQTRKNNVASSTDIQRPILTSWHKANRKRHLLINSKLSENADELSGIDHTYPLAVRQNPLWDTHGYLELINPIENIIDGDKNELAVHVHRHTTWTSLMITSCLGLVTLIVLLLWFSQRKEEHQERIESANGDVMLEYQRPQSSSFQSRYLIEYEHVRFLGRGGFGIVFEAINKLDERRVAIKRVSLKRPSGKERALKEIRCMAILNHPNLIQYYYAWNECPPHGWQDDEDRKFINTNFEVTKDSLSVFSSSIDNATTELPPLIDFTFERSLNPPPVLDDSQSSLFEHSSNKELSENVDKDISGGPRTYFYFVMELCQSASLRDRLIKQTLHHSQAWSIFDQIIKGIEYIHSQKFIHQDLKPSNILFSRDDMIKIGDFGLVSAFGEDRIERNEDHELGGTLLYMSPEQINRQSYNQKVDIYALGIILFELLYPFATQMERAHALANIRLPTPSFPEDFQYNQYICRLIRWLLSYSSHDRPKACEFRQDSSYQHILHDEHLFSQL